MVVSPQTSRDKLAFTPVVFTIETGCDITGTATNANASKEGIKSVFMRCSQCLLLHFSSRITAEEFSAMAGHYLARAAAMLVLRPTQLQ